MVKNKIEVTGEPVLIRKVKDPYGWLGNMSPYPVEWEGVTYRTTEALFQCMRFEEGHKAWDMIREQKSPMAAKMVAKGLRGETSIVPLGSEDVRNMLRCLKLKIQTYPDLRQALIETGERTIIEDCTKRPRGSGLFWGAALTEHGWAGINMLGFLWQKIRDKVKEK